MLLLLAALLLGPTFVLDFKVQVDGAPSLETALGPRLSALGLQQVEAGARYTIRGAVEAHRWTKYPHADVASFYSAKARLSVWDRGRQLATAVGEGRGQHFETSQAAQLATSAATSKALVQLEDLLRGLPNDAGPTPTRGVVRARSVSPEPKDDTPLFGQTHAVVIGIDHAPLFADLNAAQADARRVAKVLRDQGATVTLLLGADATRTRLAEVLGDRLPGLLQADDRVIIYFAGHGVSVGEGAKAMGYLMPFDANPATPRATGISMRELQAWFNRYAARHVLFVADACYSGLAIGTRHGPSPRTTALPRWLRDQARRKVRATLVAGGAGELAVEDGDHGLFTRYFLEGIDGAADADADRVVTGLELATYTKSQVSRAAALKYGRTQTPQFFQAGEGQFLFLLPALRRRAELTP